MSARTQRRQELLGRESEIGVIEQMVRVASAPGGALVLKGDPGIGKSALLTLAAERAAAQGCEVLSAQGVESEALLPFAALQQLLDPLIGRADELVPAQRGALLAALGYGDWRVPERYLVALAALNLLVVAATQRPLVLVADDVHWFDEASQESLAFLARRAGRDPFTVVAGVRTGHNDPFAHTDVAVLHVEPLDDAAAQQLLKRTAPGMSPRQRDAVADVAAGNPLALVELPVTWLQSARVPGYVGGHGLPGQLELVFTERVRGLPSRSRDVLLVAACGSTDDTTEILRAAALLHGGPIGAEALDGAVEAGILAWDGRLRFRHPLVRSAVLRDEPVSRQMAAHGAIADALPDEPYRPALHRAKSIVGPDDAVADELERNVQVALRRGDIASAVVNLELAAQLTSSPAQRGHRLLLGAQHAFALGRADLVDRLVSAASETDLSPVEIARMEWLREIFDEVPGDVTRVRELCEATASRSRRRRRRPRARPAPERGAALLVVRHRRVRARPRRHHHEAARRRARRRPVHGHSGGRRPGGGGSHRSPPGGALRARSRRGRSEAASRRDGGSRGGRRAAAPRRSSTGPRPSSGRRAGWVCSPRS